MAIVTYILHDGRSKDIEVKTGESVKDGAVNNLVPGILAECGGALACATCHVYVDEQWFDKLEPAGEVEMDMLDFAEDVRKNSRLSCQIDITEEMNGLVIHVPEEQY
ncbi:MAG: 2Fe-2S iron-sulfur cluster binding domain-containing protein [Rhodospirillales bacterium]|jgi:ferredoxin, 2Fe-2S|nr:2Fe-2S iron-sulfur cluster binding domain-containing protein [Rhodospirillales bacterium]